MYPTLYHLVADLTGLEIPIFKLVQSYGMMVAFAFVGASMVMASELRRKEALGMIGTITRKTWKGKPSSMFDKVTSGIIGFLLGFKLLELILHTDTALADTQAFFLSTQGSILGGILGAVGFVGVKIYDDKKNALPEPVEVTEVVHAGDHAGTITIIAAVVGILGAKVFHNLENLDDFFRDPVGAFVSFSGLTFYGGLICAAIAVIWYARKNNIKSLHLADCVTPGLMLAYGIGRMGCQLAGDGDWGIPNDAPMPEWLSFLPEWVWAYDYPNNVLNLDLKQDFANMGLVSLTGKAYPTPIYEVVMSFIIFAFLWIMRHRWTTPGMMSSVYLIFNGIERFFIEKIRVNNLFDFMGMQVTQAEVISMILIVCGVAGVFLTRKYGEKWAQW